MATVKPEADAAPEGKGSTKRLLGRLLEIGIFVGLFAILYFNLFKGRDISEIGSAIMNVAAVVVGIGFLIFIHELGHFLAAKWCDVKVETFSVGFGRAIPGCQRKWGETVYKLAMFPIGGYVKMLGQTDPGEKEEDQEAAITSPRSYMNKPVGQRLFIISAGVLMNLLFGLFAFIYIYMVGKTEPAPFLGPIEPASPADKAGLRAGSELVRVNDDANPSYEDVFYASLLATPGETVVHLDVKAPDGKTESFEVIPRRRREKGEQRATIGVGYPQGLTLQSERVSVAPARKGTPAAAAAGLRRGDKIVGVRPHGQGDFRKVAQGWEYARAEFDFRKGPIDVQVKRGDQLLEFTVGPNFVRTFGLAMEIGPIVSVSPRKMPPAAKELKEGDRIAELNGDASFDPMRLPDLLADAADAGKASELTIERGKERFKIVLPADQIAKSGTWNEAYTFRADSPLAIPSLGVCVWVTPKIKRVEPNSPAAKAGLTAGMIVTDIEVADKEAGTTKKTAFDEDLGWAQVFTSFQLTEDADKNLDITLIVKDPADPAGPPRRVKLAPAADPTWFFPDRGFRTETGMRTRYADGVWDAMRLGARETKRFLVRIYLTLYGFLSGNISGKSFSGPIDMARATYAFAERGFNDLILFLAMISVNLAVVNFLPIPVLDGGHAVMLVLEKLRGKPVNATVFAWATYAGLAFIICLMLSVTVLDLSKFAWFQKLFGG